MMEISLKGQVILVTGGSRGIGAGITKQLLEAGAKVAVHYNSNKSLAESVCKGFEDQSQLFQADLSDVPSIIQLFKQVVDYFGHIHGLVSNAGVAISSEEDKEEEAWAKDWDVMETDFYPIDQWTSLVLELVNKGVISLRG